MSTHISAAQQIQHADLRSESSSSGEPRTAVIKVLAMRLWFAAYMPHLSWPQQAEMLSEVYFDTGNQARQQYVTATFSSAWELHLVIDLKTT